MKRSLVVAGFAALMLSGCAVGPNYHRPLVKTPDAFRASTTPAAVPSFGDEKWFETFKDPKLQELIRTALQNNYDMRDAVARVEAARAAVGITRADQFPTIAGTADITTQRSSRNGSIPLPQGFKQERTFGTVAGSLLSYEVDVWGRLRRATEASRAQLLATDENRKTVAMTLVSDVATAYFNLLELDLELDIAKRTLATREESLRVIRIRQSRGLSTLLEVRQAEQLVQVAAEEIPSVEQRIQQTENQLSLLLAENPTSVARDRRLSDQELPADVPPGLPSSLLERRPDIRAAEENLVAANATIGVAKAAYFPQISLTGLFGFQSNQLSSLFTGPTRVWQFTPEAAQPIFTGGRLKSNVRLAEAQKKIAAVQYERTVQTAFREVSDALIQYQKVREIKDKQETLVTILQDRSRLSHRRYSGGVDSLLNSLDADRDLFDAELRLAQLKRDELVSVVQLYKALGGGWQQ